MNIVRVLGSQSSFRLQSKFFLRQIRAPRFALALVLFVAFAVPAFAQGGTAGAAAAAAADVQPPTLPPSADPMPQIADPAPPLPTLAPQPPVPIIKPAIPNLNPIYDVSKIGERHVGSGIDIYSLEKEQQLGKELSREVESESRLVTDPAVTEYINRIGQRIVRNSDAQVPFVIKVIDDDQVNAFALPGGYFYVNTGLILAADNEAELAGVMAHEIAHVAARHATKNATRQEIFNLASIPLVFIGGPAGYAARQIFSLAVPMSFLKFSRDAEREADLLGLEYQYACGYDPEEFVRFFEKLKLQNKQKHSFLAKAFSTHPMTEDRIRRAQDEIAKYLPDRNDYVVDTSEFQRVKTHLADLMNEHQIDSQSARPTLRKRNSAPDKPRKSGDDGGPPVLKHP